LICGKKLIFQLPKQKIQMRKFWLDVVFAVLFIFGLIGLFSSLTFFKIFEVFDPIGEMFADFELTDIVMSQLRVAPDADEDIVIVNIAYANRAELGVMIDILNQYNPAVIGVDIEFNQRKEFAEDSLFVEVLSRTPNVVLGSVLRQFNEISLEFDTVLLPEQRIAKHADFGYVNLLTGASSQDDLKSCREYAVYQYANGEKQYAFATKLAMYKDTVLTRKFLDRNNIEEVINYKGNVFDFGQTEFGTRYYVLDYQEVMEQLFVSDIITDKVIIMCFLGKYLGDQQTREDKYFSPLNKRYVGKSEPDMFGGVVHANIVSMILEEDYVNSMSRNSSIALAIIILILNVVLFTWIYMALPKWYDGITKIIQLIQILGASILMVWLFDAFTFKADFSFTIILIAISGDSIEVYHGVVKNLFSKKDRKDLFKINRKLY
jgi:CHASE2 domain-containing sensor protein